ncbi:ADL255Cp [Eremothecium gossypii ATCC 10895]|uniref:tRNA (adenine(58)-N(1))-methyltransferase non-catalytic subunit TRM6 n=1 Tax=Eremothecium gossypii (strain ATCC 10895 / CBS 109.51 / FGSC 9923 / NRRL Y-1056) TaxID=284811 RepID=TRM6_EREGS|nr:ADL255Cp [Eremothecium gossypii ATCC 10895]Q75B32.1 RecName: Full=tRNA (adenine(58)-N(1))-methyltransferase non-catalytic subunit TRM6; AltName: Full=tRNA(m1A58)-methyltransferase subunit TRM6; Short=tRNA(m1A58)MTase subunit TRM6 [Eremothecium gossypii ATCC 10895]AAS51665.1 ADL255Cp [Eremothecium gossypii ATCC 10895]AEY95962.1 FADL255Cp [Eremothecium gossypii FDAG1]
MDPLRQLVLNQHILVRLPSDNLKIVELKPNGVISLGKFGACHVNDIIGYPLGTTFEIWYEGDETEVVRGSTVVIGKVRVLENRAEAQVGSEGATPQPAELTQVESSKTNMELLDLGHKVQKLDHKEIERMKQDVTAGDSIISMMIQSHETFHKKTIHSQEKYLKRKKQKFAKFFTAEYLGSSGLLRYLIEKGDMQRIMDLSEESLGMALNLANIRSNGTYLCMDETGGLIVYAMLERMFGGHEAQHGGTIVVVHENEHPNLDLLKFSNYSEEFIGKHVKTVSLLQYFEPPTVEEVEASFTPLDDAQLREMKSNKKGAYYRRLKRYNSDLEVIRLASQITYDALIVASTLQLSTLVPRLAGKVHGSRPIVCYSQFRETLLELSHTLYDSLHFLAPTLLETRCRPYQTVRGKLHPLMTMRGGGGYLLWCHKVIPADNGAGKIDCDNAAAPACPAAQPDEAP